MESRDASLNYSLVQAISLYAESPAMWDVSRSRELEPAELESLWDRFR